jgi:hypothetical protein
MMKDKNGLTPMFATDVQALSWVIDTIDAVGPEWEGVYDYMAIVREVFSYSRPARAYVLVASEEQFCQSVADHELES